MKRVEKYWGRIVLSFASAIMCSLFVFGMDAQAASLRGSNNEEKVFYYLLENMDFNNAGAAGVLANVSRESNFNPRALGDNGTSFGICQWHAARYEALKRFCEREGYDYRSLDGQLNFLQEELSSTAYYQNNVLDPILSVKNNKKGAYNAGYIWCYYFEIPANREEKAVERGNLAKSEYWPRYNDVTPTLEVDEEYTTDLGTFVALSKNTVSFFEMADTDATELNIPDTVTIGSIKAKVVEIDPEACVNNKKLQKVTIGKNVKIVGELAFYKCKNLKEVRIRSTKIKEFQDDCFTKINSKCKFYVKNSVKKKYKKMISEVAPSGVKYKKLK